MQFLEAKELGQDDSKYRMHHSFINQDVILSNPRLRLTLPDLTSVQQNHILQIYRLAGSIIHMNNHSDIIGSLSPASQNFLEFQGSSLGPSSSFAL